MTYASIQTAVATQIRNATGYTTRNVTEGDYRPFARGLSKGVVLRKGATESDRLSVTANGSYPVRSRHTVIVEIYVPYRKSPATARANLITETNLVVQELRQWSGTTGVIDSGPGSLGEPEEGAFEGSSYLFWRQLFNFPVIEVETVTVD